MTIIPHGPPGRMKMSGHSSGTPLMALNPGLKFMVSHKPHTLCISTWRCLHLFKTEVTTFPPLMTSPVISGVPEPETAQFGQVT